MFGRKRRKIRELRGLLDAQAKLAGDVARGQDERVAAFRSQRDALAADLAGIRAERDYLTDLLTRAAAHIERRLDPPAPAAPTSSAMEQRDMLPTLTPEQARAIVRKSTLAEPTQSRAQTERAAARARLLAMVGRQDICPECGHERDVHHERGCGLDGCTCRLGHVHLKNWRAR